MQLTSNYKLKKPDYADTVDVQDLNGNADKIDAELSKKLDKTGEGGDLTVSFTQGPGKVNLTPGEKLSISLGKIMKWLSEMKAVAVTGNYNDLSNRLFVANNDTTTAGGFVADARIVRQHGLEIDQISTKLGGIEFKIQDSKGYYRAAGADAWTPFKGAPLYYMGPCSIAYGNTYTIQCGTACKYGIVVTLTSGYNPMVHVINNGNISSISSGVPSTSCYYSGTNIAIGQNTFNTNYLYYVLFNI